MSLVFCESYYEVDPTLEEVKQEICNLVGLPEIKTQLETIVEKITDASEYESGGFTVIPPKPFHMVFVGNNGTGKSIVAQILGKLFYLAGALTSYTVTEMQGNQKMKNAEGGVLLVNIDEEDPINSKTLEEIIAAMDEGSTSVIFAGNHKALNQYMKFNNELYKRFSARFQFDDLTCEDLAMIMHRKANKVEDNLLCGLELDALCSAENIAQIIAQVTPENLRSMLNAHLLDQMLIEAKKLTDELGENAISLRDLGIGIEKGAQIYKNLLNM
ncbi:hypothetical protein ACJIZ3_025481 [Penstemon smallii]|uniref:AAA+ ATPase domain-containing protein n=1 Tax=Penstemon smallii TaxID=265156 RepID=A0ABD3TV27_9LAMI